MRKQNKSISVLAFFMAFIAIGLFFAGMTRTVHADAPGGTPGCNICEKLDEIFPTWSQKLDGSERFKRVFPYGCRDCFGGVLDKETGLVWERMPSAEKMDWYDALSYCYMKEVAGRKGWRAPKIEELASLVDTSNEPALPTGHPFLNVQTTFYWSSTTLAHDTDAAWGMRPGSGYVNVFPKEGYGGVLYSVWCVRGGYGYDAY